MIGRLEEEEDLEGQLTELEVEIERELEERRKRVRGPYARHASCSSQEDTPTSSPAPSGKKRATLAAF